MVRTPLSDSEINTRLAKIPGWALVDGKLHRDFKFKSFTDTFAFMTKAAFISEKLDHHPSWLNVYNRLSVDLWTHDASGVTAIDFEWAKAVNEIGSL